MAGIVLELLKVLDADQANFVICDKMLLHHWKNEELILLVKASINLHGSIDRTITDEINIMWTEVCYVPGVGLMVQVVDLGSKDPKFKSHSAVELTPGGVDSA